MNYKADIAHDNSCLTIHSHSNIGIHVMNVQYEVHCSFSFGSLAAKCSTVFASETLTLSLSALWCWTGSGFIAASSEQNKSAVCSDWKCKCKMVECSVSSGVIFLFVTTRLLKDLLPSGHKLLNVALITPQLKTTSNVGSQSSYVTLTFYKSGNEKWRPWYKVIIL